MTAAVEKEFYPWPSLMAEAYRSAGFWSGMPLTDILSRQASMQPDKAAIIHNTKQLSFAALEQQSTALAQRLLDSGLQVGDHALIQLPNIPELYLAFWALLKAGIRPVVALYSHQAHELNSYIAQLNPRLVIASRNHSSFAAGEVRFAQVPLLQLWAEDLLEQGNPCPAATLPELDAQSVAFFQLSGGSTGTPKLIPRTHNDYYYSVRQSAEICALTASAIYLCALPAAHNFPLSSPGALGIWHAGGTVVLADDPSPSSCFPLIAKHKVTHTALVPTMARLWLAAALVTGDSRLQSLQVLQVGGAPLDADLAQRLEEGLALKLQQVYGMAEGLVCYTRLDAPAAVRYHSQGQPMSPGDEIKIRSESGRDLGTDEVGELWTRGPYTFRGYFCATAHNATVFDYEGFYRTGDLVMRSPEGNIRVVGRSKEQVNRGGEKIDAAEVEALLRQHPGVTAAAVIGAPDPQLGERVVAYLEGTAVKKHELRGYLRQRGLATFKWPEIFYWLPALPLTAVGKIDKASLRLDLQERTKR